MITVLFKTSCRGYSVMNNKWKCLTAVDWEDESKDWLIGGTGRYREREMSQMVSDRRKMIKYWKYVRLEGSV